MIARLLLIFSSSILAISTFAQPSIEWQKTYGGTENDQAKKLILTSDGGYLMLGSSNSEDIDLVDNFGFSDWWILKLTENGEIEWTQKFGGRYIDIPIDAKETEDGGFIIAGEAYTSDDTILDQITNDFWLLKLDANGNIVWEQNYGQDSYDYLSGIDVTADGGYIMIGHGDSLIVAGQDIYNRELLVVKTDSLGVREWQRYYGGSSGLEYGSTIEQTKDGGYLLSANTGSRDGDVSVLHSVIDYWVIKISEVGDILWEKTFGGGPGSNITYDAKITSDDGYIIAGIHGGNDCWVLKLDNLGNFVWQSSFGGSEGEFAYSIVETNDGGFLVAGSTNSNDGDVSVSYGDGDAWLVKLSEEGTIQWDMTLGGSDIDRGVSVLETDDSGYILAAQTASDDGDVLNHIGETDLWLVKLSAFSAVSDYHTLASIHVYPNPTSNYLILNFNNWSPGAAYTIVNSLGQELKMGIVSSQEFKINLPDWPSGLYYIRITDNGIEKTLGFIIE